MAIQFIVEDGTGKSDATSYVAVAEFQQYWTNKGVDYTATATYPVVTLQAWLNEATAYADLSHNWSGSIYDEDQALLVPRLGWADVYGRDLDETVPTYLKNGVCELAAARAGVDPDASIQTGIASKSYGPVSVSYRTSGRTTKYPAADRWFSKLQIERGLRNWPA